MKYLTRRSSSIIAVALIASFLFAIPTAFLDAASARGFVKGASVADLKAAYAQAAAGGEKVRILIVPGHESDYGGAEYAGYYERELVVPLSERLAAELRADPRLEVLVARGTAGWNSDFERYFDSRMSSIERFVERHKKEMKKLLRRGRIAELEEQAGHNAARTDVAFRLYGITKWSNENDVDLMIHVHLNDAGGRSDAEPGAYTGLSIYVPDRQYGNAEASRAVAEEVFARLNRYAATSTLPIEDKGVVEDQELIALGAYNTAEIPSILIEYGYIYEPKNLHEETRDAIYADQAYWTAEGVRAFFGASATGRYDARILPYAWATDSTAVATSTTSVGLYALQVALRDQGFYPPAPSTLINCPIDGVMRNCVTDALAAYQKAKDLAETGTLSLATRTALNAAYAPPSVVASVPPASGAACAPFGATLALGSTDGAGSAVTRLQAMLAQDPNIYPEGSVTGYFGPLTDRAVKAFQVKHGIASAGSQGYGLVGPLTTKALLAACAV
ncbi:MAG TPA: peptidoglycan-binding protein [Candidatus Paceibacterota bacterium]|nr:peptidoglycan-binding protein [Candidatus Paceibacterota bacterium]